VIANLDPCVRVLYGIATWRLALDEHDTPRPLGLGLCLSCHSCRTWREIDLAFATFPAADSLAETTGSLPEFP
jgi:hypothetical protein